MSENEKKHLPPEGMAEPPNFSKIPKEFVQAYSYAFAKCKQANPGKPVNIASFHAMLDKWSKEQEALLEEFIKKGTPKREGDNLVWGT